MSIRQNNIDWIIENPKPGYFPHNNEGYLTDNKKYHNKKYAIGMLRDLQDDRRKFYICPKIRTGYWVFYNKGNNIVEC